MIMVVLDGHTLNPGDLSWEGIKNQGELIVYDRTSEDEIVDRCQGAEVIFTNKTPLKKAEIQQLPDLKFIGVLATGYNVVDTAFAKSRNIMVSNVPGYGTSSVVQMTFALLLELCLHVQQHSESVHAGDWTKSPDFCYWNYPLVELAGKTIGIIGFGSIGQRVADVASAFGMEVIGHSRRQTDQYHRKNFRWVALQELLEQSDVVSLHCPITPETNGLINKASLAKMKKTAFLLNTSRGPLVVDQDLAEALNTNTIAGAGIDVLSVEPPVDGNILFKARNCVITPHIAWATKEARNRLMDIAAANLAAYLSGNPVNLVN